jgi:hypothetical protein
MSSDFVDIEPTAEAFERAAELFEVFEGDDDLHDAAVQAYSMLIAALSFIAINFDTGEAERAALSALAVQQAFCGRLKN